MTERASNYPEAVTWARRGRFRAAAPEAGITRKSPPFRAFTAGCANVGRAPFPVVSRGTSKLPKAGSIPDMGHTYKDEGDRSYGQNLKIEKLAKRMKSVVVDISMIRRLFFGAEFLALARKSPKV